MQKQLGMSAMNKTELKPPNKQQFRIMVLTVAARDSSESENLLLWEK
jgi:hypothetical protein